MSRFISTASVALGLACAAAVLSPSAAFAASPGAASAPPGARSCFFARQLSNFTAVGEQTLNLRVNLHDYYQLKMLGRCTDLPWTEVIGLETRGGSDFVCSGLDVVVIVPRHGAGGHDRCMATELRKLTPEEVKALPPKQKP